MSKKPSLPGADALFGATGRPEGRGEEKDDASKSTSVVCTERASKPVNKPTRKSHRTPGRTAPATKIEHEELQKYTLYFSRELLDKLEETWFRLRRSRRDKVTKWKIVHVLLESHLDDIDHLNELLDQS